VTNVIVATMTIPPVEGNPWGREWVGRRYAAHVTDALKRPTSVWPVDTGRSKANFYPTDTQAGMPAIANRMYYAVYVNNRPRYPSGKRNPNYQAVQREAKRSHAWIRARMLAEIARFPAFNYDGIDLMRQAWAAHNEGKSWTADAGDAGPEVPAIS